MAAFGRNPFRVDGRTTCSQGSRVAATLGWRPQPLCGSQIVSVLPRIVSVTSQIVSVALRIVSVTPRVVSVTSQIVSVTSRIVSVTSQIVSVTSRVVSVIPRIVSVIPRIYAALPNHIDHPHSRLHIIFPFFRIFAHIFRSLKVSSFVSPSPLQISDSKSASATTLGVMPYKCRPVI